MKYWIISDTHFSHRRMIELCGRPENFESKIIDNLYKIPESDILIHLGDVCIGYDAQWHDTLKRLKCKKWLVKGNHDSKSNSWYLTKGGWNFVADSFSLNIYGYNILFSHIPQEGNFDFNVHGHLHNNDHRGKYDDRSHILISLEDCGYQQQNLETLIYKKEKKNESKNKTNSSKY